MVEDIGFFGVTEWRSGSQEFHEFLDGEPRLPNDVAQGAGRQVTTPMDRHRHSLSRVVGMFEDVMAASRPQHDETRALESAQEPAGVHGRQPRTHDARATFTAWIVAGVPTGISSPLSERISRASSIASLAMESASASVSP